nr:hypothetical protein [Nanoarchaeota archaeon]
SNDADDDIDDDGLSNLEEYLAGTDPTDPYDPMPEKKHTLQIIFLILGLLLILGSTGFLVYSRKVLIPKQRAAIAKQPRPQRPLLQRRPLIRGIRARLFGRRLLAKRPATVKEIKSVEKEAVVPPEKLIKKAEKPAEEFVSLSKLKKKPEGTKAPKKPKGKAFEKLEALVKEKGVPKKSTKTALKELSDSYKKRIRKKKQASKKK